MINKVFRTIIVLLLSNCLSMKFCRLFALLSIIRKIKSLITEKVEMIAICFSESTPELRVGTEIYFTYWGEGELLCILVTIYDYTSKLLQFSSLDFRMHTT